MRINEIKKTKTDLTKSKSPEQLAEEYFKLIQRDCKKALAACRLTNKFIYRGVRTTKQMQAFKGQSRSDRRPLDTDRRDQTLLDNFLVKAGFDAVRSNSIFGTSDLDTAEEYGHLFVIFPFDDAKITWNSKKADLFNGVLEAGASSFLYKNVDDYAIEAAEKLNELRYDLEYIQEYSPEINQDKALKNIFVGFGKFTIQKRAYYERVGYDTIRNPEVIHARIENDIKLLNTWAKTLSTIKIENQKPSDAKQTNIYVKKAVRLTQVIINWLQKTKLSLESATNEKYAKELASKLGFVKDNLPAAIKSKHEIYISGKYYAFRSKIDLNVHHTVRGDDRRDTDTFKILKQKILKKR